MRSGRHTALLFALLAMVTACGDDDPAERRHDDDPPPVGPTVFDHRAVDDFAAVTPADCEAIRAAHRIYYGHTSHGSQIVTGMRMLAAENACYQLPEFHEVSDDLGTAGDVSWAAVTRAFLDAHPGEVDVVMWSWCGGVSGNTVEGIDAYLAAMAALESDYPDVTFVYMTGHLDGSGTGGTLWPRNEQIRAWCRDHGKVLFDFAAIETYDPAGVATPTAATPASGATTGARATTAPIATAARTRTATTATARGWRSGCCWRGCRAPRSRASCAGATQ